jgi:MFS family permease
MSPQDRRPPPGPDPAGTAHAPPGDEGPHGDPSTPRETRRGRLGAAGREVGRGVGRAAAVSGRGVRRVGTATGSAAGYTFRQARRATHAEGAGQSGLSRLIELHAFNAAGDTAVAISLAGTLFFQVPTEQARGQVALFLGLTLLPFAIVAPLIGPFLDRYSHGRRWAVGATMAVRGFLCWVLADAVATGSAVLFPAALGCLVASKAYTVTRAAAVPRLLPEQLSLVKANARISLAGVAGAAVSAPLAVLASQLGSQWSLRYAFAVFVAGTVLAVLLPAKVDHAAGDREPLWRRRPMRGVPRPVVLGLRSNAGIRLLSGFLTLFMAFLLRDAPFPGWEARPELLIGLVIGAAGFGGAVGIALASVLRSVRPEITVVVALVAGALVTTVVAFLYGLPTAVLLGLTAGLAQTFGKLSLDALIQRDIPDQTRASAFGRSEMLLQLSWVAGGFLGIALPLDAQIGLGVTAAVLVAWAAFVVISTRGDRRDAATVAAR